MIRKLALEIESATKTCMEEKYFSLGTSHSALGKSEWESVWPDLAEKYLGFYAADQRPFVVYPENAAEAIRDICPQADFTVIILGRNVSKSIFFDSQKDIYPAVNRTYIDLGDIRHSQTEAEVRDIACFISERIAERLILDGTDGPFGR